MTHEARGVGRSIPSYGDVGFSRYLRAAFLTGAGYDAEDLAKPIVGIADLSSDYNPCHRLMPQLVEQVERGVLEAGGLPFVFPTISLHESFASPAMHFRSLLARETEEMIRAQSMDAVVLLGGCDKTVPAQLMTAASSDVPVLLDVVGSMTAGSWRGERLGACTDCRRFWARYRGGELQSDEISSVEGSLVSTAGSCMVMGTAWTMAGRGGGARDDAPERRDAAGSDRAPAAVRDGHRSARRGPGPRPPGGPGDDDAGSVRERPGAAVGHGGLDERDHPPARGGPQGGRRPGARRLRPRVTRHAAAPGPQAVRRGLHGGLPQRRRCTGAARGAGDSAGRHARRRHRGVAGRPARRGAPPQSWRTVIRTPDDPVGPTGALAVLRGSLAPDEAVIKVSAATPGPLRHRGPALVFDSPEDAAERLDDPELDVTAQHVLVLRNAGPSGAGMPEAGSLPLPLPRKLGEAGGLDMVRVSDARMSGTSYGTVVLHCCPKSAAGGPLALVRDGDLIELDVPARRSSCSSTSRSWRSDGPPCPSALCRPAAGGACTPPPCCRRRTAPT